MSPVFRTPCLKAALIALLCVMAMTPSVMAQESVEFKQKLAAMELTLFGKTFCKDTPIRRLERLEENFVEAQKQKEKGLPERINDIMERVKPSKEFLQKPDPCEEKDPEKSKGLMDKLIGGHQESEYIESNDYPLIKWKAVEIPKIEKAVVQLTSDFTHKGKGYGTLKYRVVVRLPEGSYFPRMFTVTFYDQNKFKLNKFVIGQGFFKDTGAPNQWEANDSVPFIEHDYKSARSYSVDIQ